MVDSSAGAASDSSPSRHPANRLRSSCAACQSEGSAAVSTCSIPVAEARTAPHPGSENHRLSGASAPWRSDTCTRRRTSSRAADASTSLRRIVPIDPDGSCSSHEVSSTTSCTAQLRSGQRGSGSSPTRVGGVEARSADASIMSARRHGHATSIAELYDSNEARPEGSPTAPGGFSSAGPGRRRMEGLGVRARLARPVTWPHRSHPPSHRRQGCTRPWRPARHRRRTPRTGAPGRSSCPGATAPCAPR